MTKFQNYLPIAQSIERLLHPYAEVVIHDLSSNTIAAIFNSYSQRKVGDDSLLDEMALEEGQAVIGPYEKRNWDGRKLKSISTILYDNNHQAIGLLCINLDISQLALVQETLHMFMNSANLIPQPAELFRDDWQEKINLFVHNHLAQHHTTLNALTRNEKRNLVLLLSQEGAFKGKHAAAYAAKVLKLSRATVYKYLRKP